MAALNGKILRYTLLPGFLPRIRNLFASGFVHIAYSMALIYQAVRLLPADHAYLQPQNIGRYGIRHVMSEAANNLVFSWKNIDQILIFFTILTGIVLLLAQFALFIVAMVAQQPVYAALVDSWDVVGVNSQYGHGKDGTGSDIAFIILDRVFGLQGVYNSCISDPGNICVDLGKNKSFDPGSAYPFPFHLALHKLLRFYSMGIFVMSVMVIIYFIITMIGETAVSGHPFGQRFNKTWMPVRVILFFALLCPLNIGAQEAGLNGAQMITFYVAKFGSNFATNTWGIFNDTLSDTYLGKTADLVATPQIPEINSLVRFMFLAKTCKLAEEFAYQYKPESGKSYPNGVQAYIVRDDLSALMAGGGPTWLDFSTTTFDQAVDFNNNGTIDVRFGARDPDKYGLEKGDVFPVCGSLKIPVTSLKTGINGSKSGSYGVQEVYFNLVKDMWKNPRMTQAAICVRNRIMAISQNPNCATPPSGEFARNEIIAWKNDLKTKMPAQIKLQVTNSDFGVSAQLRATGWAGAAIWYNRIAQVNGELVTAIGSVPAGDKFPYIMQKIAEANKAKNENVNPADLFNPALAEDEEATYPRYKDRPIAATLYNAYMLWDRSETTTAESGGVRGNAVIDIINLIFGTQGIFDMRENVSIHPLAQLSALGKSMMEASMRNIFMGFTGGGVASLLQNYGGNLAKPLADFIMNMGKITVVMSFILYYVLPFLPFIYFFFAVSGWVKSIFEAIVAMPLWALSHITRLDGNGIPGPGANNGYFLLLEIFLRPVLIVFGLIASLSIFSASVFVLNDSFKLITANLTGFNMESAAKAGPTEMAYYRAPLDTFFFSTLYVILCYMMALAFFKMIDQVPNNILRWMGVSVSTFSEAAGDPADTLVGKIFSSGTIVTAQIRGGGQLTALLGK